MKVLSNFAMFVFAVTLLTQTCHGQLRSVMQRDGQDVEHVARLPQQPVANSYSFQADRIIANRPSVAPSVLSNREASSENVTIEISALEMAIRIEGPEKMSANTPATFFATIENPGTNAIQDIKVELDKSGPFRVVANSVDSLLLKRLEPKHRARFEFQVVAQKCGSSKLKFNTNGVFTHANHSVATRSGSGECEIEVSPAPVLVHFTGPSLMYIGNSADYSIKVSNTGEQMLQDLIINLKIPHGLEVAILDRQANIDPQRGEIEWTLPSIPANESEVILLRANANAVGMQLSRVKLNQAGQTSIATELVTNVIGEPQKRSNVTASAAPSNSRTR